MFENNGHIHVYSPEAGTDNPLGSSIFHKHTCSVNLVISCKFPHYMTFKQFCFSFKCISLAVK